MGIFLAVVSALTFAITNFISKTIINKKANSIFVTVFFQVFAGLFFIPLLLTQEVVLPNSSEYWVWFFIVIILYTIQGLSGFAMYKYLDISLASILGQSRTLFSFIGALILFNESATILKILGMGLIIAGNLVLFIGKKSKRTISVKGLILVGINIFCIVTTSLIDAKISGSFSINVYGFLAYLLPGLFALIPLLKKIPLSEVKIQMRKYGLSVLLMGIVGPIGYSALLYAYQIAPKSVVYPLNSLTTIFLVFMGIIILKEKSMIKRKLIAGVIVFIGAALLSI